MSTYRRADTRTQWFADDYPGARIDPNVVVLHTTEGTTWPWYSGGATAPNATAKPNIADKRLAWRQHFPDEMSARALRNEAGGVETNTLNALQVELVGTCDPAHRHRWGSLVAGEDYIYWPDAPAWALDAVGDYIADLHKRHGIKLQAPEFLAYPASYGDSVVRFTFFQWRNFYGVCGHQHVPENDHGDPGNIDIGQVLARAKALTNPKPKPAPKPAKRKRLTIRTANIWRENPAIDADLDELLSDRAAHLVCLNEAGLFTDEVRAAAGRHGYQAYGVTGKKVHRQNPILVRDDIRVFDHHVYDMCDALGTSPARTATAVMFFLAGRKRAHINGHAPAGVQAGPGNPRELPRVRRQYVPFMAKLEQLVDEGRAHGWATTVSGDLNWSWIQKVTAWRWEPRRVFHRLGMRVQWAGRDATRPSHGRRRIDYLAHDPHDLYIESQRLMRGHSDHRWPEVTYNLKETP